MPCGKFISLALKTNSFYFSSYFLHPLLTYFASKLKLRYCEKATKFEKKSYTCFDVTEWEIFKKMLAFSENMNYIKPQKTNFKKQFQRIKDEKFLKF